MTANDHGVQLLGATAGMSLLWIKDTTCLECIHAGTRPIVTPAHGFHVLEIVLTTQESGRDAQAKLIESTFTPPCFPDKTETVAAPVAAHLLHDPKG